MAFVAFCAAAPAAPRAQTPSVVATVGMLGDVAAEIGAECVQVEVMMGPGIDPHLYQASAGDVRVLQQAAAILYVGNHLEGQLGDVLSRFGQRVPTVALAEQGIAKETLIATDDAYGVDPHVWMDASLWAQTVPVVAETLSHLAQDCAVDIGARADAYRRQLEALHGWIGEAIASIPPETRMLVTAHDAFAYYGRAYGIEVRGIQGISTEAEAGIGDIRQVIDQVVASGVPAIFVESTINPRTVQAVVDGAADQGHALVIGGELYSDAMGAADTAGGTYIGMLYENTRTIVDALGGTLPDLPDDLRAWAERWL